MSNKGVKKNSDIDMTSKESVKKNYKFSIEGLAQGIYYIDFHNNAGRTFKKIIKL